MTTYRVDNHQPQNVYRDDQYPPPSGPRTMPDPLCVVHRGRRIRGPKPDSESGVRPWN